MGDEKSLAHTRWNCKYHIVFAPKYRRQVFYGEKRRAIGSVLQTLALIELGKQAGFSLMEIAGMFDLEGKPIPDRGRLAAKAREIDKTIQPLTSIYA
ncbi:hypothetical protein DDT52_02315 [Brenneria roseae subsp. roseae]|nr:hypothetical protein DDT52_02315 [Brenneria roseae subsp. roseae]